MRTYVIGDIGGHPDVLTKVLDAVGADTSGRLPDDVRVVQVGDFVRVRPYFREANTELAQRTLQLIILNGPSRWVQLIGNHESAALGGGVCPGWDLDASFETEAMECMREMWASGLMVQATSLCTPDHGPALITHAGLSRERWKQMGSPTTPEEAADIINVTNGQNMEELSSPGWLVRRPGVFPDADTMWAIFSTEVIPGWMSSDDAPFSQIHGHSGPYYWNQDQWSADASEGVRRATTVYRDRRNSVTTLPGSGRVFRNVDWSLENYNPPSIWPLYYAD